jgi:ketosteroid isomerase-like protein
MRDPVPPVHDFVAAINRHDVAGIVELTTPDHQFIDALGAVVAGRERVRTAWQGYFTMIPDYRIDLDDTLAHRDTVVLVGRAGGTYAPDGRLTETRRWQVPAGWRAVVREGRVALWQVYADNEPLRAIIARERGASSDAHHE